MARSKEEERLDFTKTAQEVYNHIRAYYPSPIAYTIFNGEILKIYESRVLDDTHNKEIGTFFLKDKTRICVACNNHTVLELLVVQPSGKKVMKAKDFANGGFRKYLK